MIGSKQRPFTNMKKKTINTESCSMYDEINQQINQHFHETISKLNETQRPSKDQSSKFKQASMKNKKQLARMLINPNLVPAQDSICEKLQNKSARGRTINGIMNVVSGEYSSSSKTKPLLLKDKAPMRLQVFNQTFEDFKQS